MRPARSPNKLSLDVGVRAGGGSRYTRPRWNRRLLKPAYDDPELFPARFLLLKRGDMLNQDEQARLDRLFDAHRRLRSGWDERQELHSLYLVDNHHGTLQALGSVHRSLRHRPARQVPHGRRHHHRREDQILRRIAHGSPTPTTSPPEDFS